MKLMSGVSTFVVFKVDNDNHNCRVTHFEFRVMSVVQTTEQRSEFLWLKYSVTIIPALHCTVFIKYLSLLPPYHLPSQVRTRTVARPDRGRAIIFLISWEILNSNTTRLSIIEIHDCLHIHPTFIKVNILNISEKTCPLVSPLIIDQGKNGIRTVLVEPFNDSKIILCNYKYICICL